MKAAHYSSKGPARDLLVVGEEPDPAPQTGEVLVRIAHSGVNPSDVKSRSGVTSPTMEFPRVIPHSDGAGVIEAVGAGVSEQWIGRRVWTINAQWQRPFGTAAELIALSENQVAPLPDSVSTETDASLGIPLLTAWYAVHEILWYKHVPRRVRHSGSLKPVSGEFNQRFLRRPAGASPAANPQPETCLCRRHAGHPAVSPAPRRARRLPGHSGRSSASLAAH